MPEPRDSRILLAFMDSDRTLEDVAASFGLSRARIRQIIERKLSERGLSIRVGLPILRDAWRNPDALDAIAMVLRIAERGGEGYFEHARKWDERLQPHRDEGADPRSRIHEAQRALAFIGIPIAERPE